MIRNASGQAVTPEYIQISKDVESKMREDLSGVTEYRVTEGSDHLGNLMVYTPGIRAIGCNSVSELPIPIPQMVGESGLKLISRLSSLRFQNSYVLDDLFNPETFERYYFNEGVGASVEDIGLPSDLRFMGDSSSLRRHLSVWGTEKGKRVSVYKILGEDSTHYNVDEANFSSAAAVYNHYLDSGVDPPLAAPVAYVDIPSSVYARCKDVRFYGQRRADDFSPKYLLMQQLDGQRIIRNGQHLSDSNTVIEPEYVGRVGEINGLDPETLVEDMFAKPFKVLAHIHQAGYFARSDAHFGNFMLCTDGRVRFVSDLGASVPKSSQDWNTVRDLSWMDDSMSNVQRSMGAEINRGRWENLSGDIWSVLGRVSDGKALYRI